MVFNTKVVDDQDKGNGTGWVAEQAAGGGLDKPPPGKETYQAVVGKLPRLFETIDGLVGAEETVGATGSPVGFGEGG